MEICPNIPVVYESEVDQFATNFLSSFMVEKVGSIFICVKNN